MNKKLEVSNPYYLVAIIVSIAMIVAFGIHWNNVMNNVISNSEYERIDESYASNIRFYDEVLTNSAMLSSATGDPQWEKRYRIYEAKLDSQIKDVINHDMLSGFRQMLQVVDSANMILVAIENRVFDLVRENKSSEALAIINGSEYARQKAIYAKGLADYIGQHKKEAEEQQMEIRNIVKINKLYTCVLIILLMIIWALVSRRLRKERKLIEETNLELRILLENSPSMTYSCPADGKFNALSISENIKEKLGYDNKEFLNIPGFWAMNIHPDDKENVFNGISILFEEGQYKHQYRFKHKDGSWRWMSDSLKLVNNKDGSPKEILGYWKDVTEQKLAEEDLLQTNGHLLATLNSLPVILFEVDSDGRIFDYRAPQTELLYAPPEMFLGKTIREILPTDSCRIIYQAIAESVATGSHKGACYSLQTPAGLNWYELSISVKDYSFLKQDRYVVLVNDVTERKKSEEKIAMLAQAVENTDENVGMTDNEYRLIFVNDSFCNTYGHRREELIGQSIAIIHSENNNAEVSNNLFSSLRKNQSWKGEALNKRKDGIDFPVQLSVTPILNEKGEFIGSVGITRDITPQKQHEQVLLQAKEEAQMANRAKSEFLANMSHELRTPLNGIIGMAELTTHTALDNKQLRFVQNIKKSGESLLAIINDLLDFSKIEAGKMELQEDEFIIRDELASVLKPLGMSASEKNIELLYAVESTIPAILITDPLRLLQIIINLVGNSLKFTKQGSIIVKVKEESRIGETINLHFIISDTGIGIAKEKQELIFSAFEQADSSVVRQFGGTGLGLSISSALVKLFGGHIWVESHLDKGTDFHFSIPIKISTKPGKKKYYTENSDDLRVLIVENSKTSGELLKQLFTVWRMKPTIESSGESALIELRKALLQHNPYQLLSLDIGLPGINGFAVMETIKQDEDFSNLPIIMISKSHNNSDYDKAQKMGVDAFFTKPFSHSELLETIHEVLLKRHTPDDKFVNVSEELWEHSILTEYQLPPLHILVAEDNVINQEIIYELLLEKSHQVTLAKNGKEAFDLSINNHFDLILMDIQMPVMDGITATQQIRLFENGKHVPIIALTARAMKEDKKNCLAAGMDAWVSKPLRPRELFKAMHKLLSEKAVTPEPQFQDEDVDIDLFTAIEIFEGNKKLLKRIIEIYLDKSPQVFQELEQSFALNDKDVIYNALHKFKGGFPAFIPKNILDFYMNLEQSVKEGNLSGLNKKTEQMTKYQNRMIEKFNELLTELSEK